MNKQDIIKGIKKYKVISIIRGASKENMNEYFNCGICGLGIGSDIVNKKLIESKNYETIKENALKYTRKIGHP